ncbi:MAG: MTAP family purine nucleoside phosphorylase [Anaerolineaceae bacterium]|nr:MTAP family purine nucleoside phosphorylase [Anaerolineaceae bacterium]
MPVGIIAGTAIYDIPGIELEEKSVSTPYGDTLVFQGKGDHEDLFFLPRHGPTHTNPPHKVNYRANIKALEQLGIKKVLAAYAIGSINPEMPPLSLMVIRDFMDFTSGREATFFDGGVNKVKHVELSEAYDAELSETIVEMAGKRGIAIHPNAVYAAMNGPRLETPAEIRMLKMLGADVVGMTGVPEVVLARELDIRFAAVGFSINWAAGIEKTIIFYEKELPKLKKDLLTLFIDTLHAS